MGSISGGVNGGIERQPQTARPGSERPVRDPSSRRQGGQPEGLSALMTCSRRPSTSIPYGYGVELLTRGKLPAIRMSGADSLIRFVRTRPKLVSCPRNFPRLSREECRPLLVPLKSLSPSEDLSDLPIPIDAQWISDADGNIPVRTTPLRAPNSESGCSCSAPPSWPHSKPHLPALEIHRA